MPESFDVFLSYNWQDQAEVQQVYLRLQQQGIKAWLDRADLGPGVWRENIQGWMSRIPVCLIFLGPHGFGGNQRDEIAAAQHLQHERNGYTIIPVLLPGVQHIPQEYVFLNNFNYVQFRASLEEMEPWRKLTAHLKGQKPLQPMSPGVGDCPYRGLEKFDVEHADLFFGREELTDTLLKKVTAAIAGGTNRRFLAIEGASGSGKSSLARAGLLARLKNGALEKSEQWRCGIVQPGGDPLYSLALEVGRALGQDTTAILNLKKEFGNSAETLKTHWDLHLGNEPQHVRFLLLVDQFEELYTSCKDEPARQAFIENLLHASQAERGRGVVVVAVRADFLGKCAGHAELARAMSDSCALVAP
jgi:hypothetical protein